MFNEAEQADSNEANDVDSITSSGDVTHNENTANAIENVYDLFCPDNEAWIPNQSSLCHPLQ